MFLLDFGKEAPKQKRKGRRQIINDALGLNAPSVDDELVLILGWDKASVSLRAQHMSRFSKHVAKGPPVRTRGLLGQWLSLAEHPSYSVWLAGFLGFALAQLRGGWGA